MAAKRGSSERSPQDTRAFFNADYPVRFNPTKIINKTRNAVQQYRFKRAFTINAMTFTIIQIPSAITNVFTC